MRSHSPILIVTDSDHAAVLAALVGLDLPLVRSSWNEAPYALSRYAPIAIVALNAPAHELDRLAAAVAIQSPYLPMIVANPHTVLPANVLPCSTANENFSYLAARVKAALRVRALHATLLRRLSDTAAPRIKIPDTDPIEEATILLLGRGATYPALSVAFGEQLAVVGALSIEAAAKHLSARDMNGIVLTDGFTPRVTDAFLTVLSEDSRFRSLPVILNSVPASTYDLPNLEIRSGPSQRVVANALPLIRQHAFEARMRRALASIDASGLLDVRTGLLTQTAFASNFATMLADTPPRRSGSASIARFGFPKGSRLLFDSARIVSRLMRQMDFGAVHDDGSILVAFMDSDLRTAQGAARRIANVIRHTDQSGRGGSINPTLTTTAVMPGDTAEAILHRLGENHRRAAS